jgi:hypothetical protein
MQGMPMKMLFTYQEATRWLPFKTYNAVQLAVQRGALKNEKVGRRVFIHWDEICRVGKIAKVLPGPGAGQPSKDAHGVMMFLG